MYNVTDDSEDYSLFANITPSVNIPPQIDNYAINGMANGIVNLFAEVAANLQVKYGTSSAAWVNVTNDLDDIIYADHIRSLGLDSTDTVALQSNDLVNRRALFVNRRTIDKVNTPAAINDSTGNLLKNYQVLIHEKQFANTKVTSNVSTLNTFISNTLDNNPVYSKYNVNSSRDFAVKNGYTSGYAVSSDSQFDPYSNSKDMQDLAEIKIAATKSLLLNSKIVK